MQDRRSQLAAERAVATVPIVPASSTRRAHHRDRRTDVAVAVVSPPSHHRVPDVQALWSSAREQPGFRRV
jgi:hypothetical protein